jgi:hypothetical protein
MKISLLPVLAALLVEPHLAGQPLPAKAPGGNPNESQESELITKFLKNLNPSQARELFGDLNQLVADAPQLLFTVSFQNDNFADPLVHASIQVASGHPTEMAILINNSNLSAAAWQPYSSTFDVTLGPADGRFEVWLGLRDPGPPPIAHWSMQPLRLKGVRDEY